MKKTFEKMEPVYRLVKETATAATTAVRHGIEDRRAKRQAVADAEFTAKQEQERAQKAVLGKQRTDAIAAIRSLGGQRATTNKSGIAQVIAEKATTDPVGALSVAKQIQSRVRDYNAAVVQKVEADAIQDANADAERSKLNAQPYRVIGTSRTADKFLSKDKIAGSGRLKKVLQVAGRAGLLVFDGASNLTSRVLAAGIQGDIKSIGDDIEVRGDRITLRSSGDLLASQEFSLEDFQEGEIQVSPSWPNFLDKIVGVLGAVIPPRIVELGVPFGQVVMYSKGRDKPLAQVPVWLPAWKADALSALGRKTRYSDGTMPQFLPDLPDDELLGPAARALTPEDEQDSNSHRYGSRRQPSRMSQLLKGGK